MKREEQAIVGFRRRKRENNSDNNSHEKPSSDWSAMTILNIWNFWSDRPKRSVCANSNRNWRSGPGWTRSCACAPSTSARWTTSVATPPPPRRRRPKRRRRRRRRRRRPSTAAPSRRRRRGTASTPTGFFFFYFHFIRRSSFVSLVFFFFVVVHPSLERVPAFHRSRFFFLLQIGSCKIDVVEVMESVATLVPKVLFFGGLAPPPTRWAVVDWPRNWRSQNLRRNRSKSNVISNHIFSNSIWVRLESSFHRRSPLVERLEATLLLRKETR